MDDVQVFKLKNIRVCIELAAATYVLRNDTIHQIYAFSC